MKKIILALSLVLATPLAALDRMTLVQCGESLARLASMGLLPLNAPAVQTDDAGWCVLEDVEFNMSRDSKLRISSLRWRMSDVDRLIEDGLPPRTVEVEGRGLGIIPFSGDAVVDYLLALQLSQMQIGFGALVRWDGLQNEVILDTAYIDLDRDNRIKATARIEGANLTDVASIQTSMGSVGLRDLTVTSQFDGWFEVYAAPSIGDVLLETSDVSPEAQVAALKRHAAEVVRDLPEDFMPQNSRDALVSFIGTLPNPKGTAQFQLSAQPTLGAARFITLTALPSAPSLDDVVETGLNGVTALFTWTPTGDAE